MGPAGVGFGDGLVEAVALGLGVGVGRAVGEGLGVGVAVVTGMFTGSQASALPALSRNVTRTPVEVALNVCVVVTLACSFASGVIVVGSTGLPSPKSQSAVAPAKFNATWVMSTRNCTGIFGSALSTLFGEAEVLGCCRVTLPVRVTDEPFELMATIRTTEMPAFVVQVPLASRNATEAWLVMGPMSMALEPSECCTGPSPARQ